MKGSLETAAITIGSKLAPVITKVAEFITDLVNKFSALPEGVHTAIVVIGAIIAVLGPLLMIIGQVAMGISSISLAFSKMSALGGLISKLVTTVSKMLSYNSLIHKM